MQGQGDISVELSAYLDGQLTPEAARWVNRAVAESPDVARRLHDLRRIRTILRAIEPIRPGPDFVARVLAEARRRGLMRRVLREQMLRGVVRLASAAAAVLLVAVVTGVAVQGLINRPGPLQPAGTRGGTDAPAVAAVPESVGGGSAALEDLRKGGVERLATIAGTARTLDLAVTDLGAGAKEVTAVLADAGISRFSAHGWQLDSTGPISARRPMPKPTAPSAETGADEVTGFSPMHGEPDELRFIVMAPPDRIDAVTRRLDGLRQRDNAEEASNGLCIVGVSRPAAVLPKAASTQSANSPDAKAATGSPAEPYHAAELQRLNNSFQSGTGQRQATTATASQAARAPGPRNETIIITVRLRRGDANRPDPARNVKQ